MKYEYKVVPLIPDAASTMAPQVDRLYGFTLGISIFFSVLVAGLVIGFCIRFRKSRHAPAPVVHNPKLEMGWIGALLVLFLAMYAWASVVYARIREVPPGAMTVRVVAKQWMWKFQYENGKRTINELYAPVGRPVRLLMTSQDVIHSFYVPAFREKQDVLPFRYTTLWFQARRTGRYHLFCAEYCGLDHARMGGWVYTMQPADFARWLEQKPEGPAANASGEELFSDLGCATCHVMSRGLAPRLEGIYDSTVILNDGSTVQADEAYLRESIVNPAAKVVAGFRPIMPVFHNTLSQQQLSALVEYIKGLKGEQR